ncbi:hypothetical protein B0T16DRAFT_249517 [Cercophora newfieldiana]|uniref:Uncharacterized protein n=1 Tax=Cercophora newfieldiana TaxID=92897 RepID=A0AA39XTF4_9PEZI|nr:hypothetical protein B0T16DRAFT_249517 [Cercophora newfieldiana]
MWKARSAKRQAHRSPSQLLLDPPTPEAATPRRHGPTRQQPSILCASRLQSDATVRGSHQCNHHPSRRRRARWEMLNPALCISHAYRWKSSNFSPDFIFTDLGIDFVLVAGALHPSTTSPGTAKAGTPVPVRGSMLDFVGNRLEARDGHVLTPYFGN